MENTVKLIAICGPTASGKSALALRTAEKYGGEIVSLDSMQLYRALPIGTAQPSPEEKARVPHHLTGILELSQKADVFDFCRRADECISAIRARGRLPILCGGTGLYFRALLCGLDDLPADPAVRKELDERFDRDDAAHALRDYASALDPAAWEKWHACRRRLLRALEVKLITGKSLLELQSGSRSRRFDAVVCLLDPERETLKAQILRRTEKMLRDGWIAEAEAAIAAGLFTSPTAHQALGYRQIADFLAGKLSRDELVSAIATATWQYARRQRTWFRHQEPAPDFIYREIPETVAQNLFS